MSSYSHEARAIQVVNWMFAILGIALALFLVAAFFFSIDKFQRVEADCSARGGHIVQRDGDTCVRDGVLLEMY